MSTYAWMFAHYVRTSVSQGSQEVLNLLALGRKKNHVRGLLRVWGCTCALFCTSRRSSEYCSSSSFFCLFQQLSWALICSATLWKVSSWVCWSSLMVSDLFLQIYSRWLIYTEKCVRKWYTLTYHFLVSPAQKTPKILYCILHL